MAHSTRGPFAPFTSYWSVVLMVAALVSTGCSSSNNTDTGGGTVTPAISITSVAPSSGSKTGGTSVIITGTGFAGTVSAKFGSVSANVSVSSSTRLTAVAPAQTTTGTVDVVVTSSENASATFARGFTYVDTVGVSLSAPAITAVSPATGPLSGNQLVTITGTGFQSDTAVTFGGLAATGVTFTGTTSIQCRTPAGVAAGAVDVAVTSASSGNAKLTAAYTYLAALTLTSISPAGGPVIGGQPVTITGTNFGVAGGASPIVTFGGTVATGVVVNGTFTSVTCTTPAHGAGLVDVVVTSAVSGTATLTAAYRYTELSATPRQSSSIAISEDTSVLYVCNPETNTVSLFDASSNVSPTKLGDVAVGLEPRSVAVLSSGNKAYVANARSGTVSVIGPSGQVTATIAVGVEPRAVVLSPNGTQCFVANAMSGTVSVIDTASDTVVSTIDLSAFTANGASQPRALAMTNDGDFSDANETLYVAMFFAERRPGKGSKDEGQDDQRRGVVVAIPPSGVPVAVTLDPIVPASYGLGLGGPDGTGFLSNGSVLNPVATAGGAGGIAGPAPTNPVTQTFATGCFPNQLASLAIQPTGNRFCYVVSTGASPNGPARFDVNVQGLVSTINTTNAEVRAVADTSGAGSAPLNMNRGLGAAAINGNNTLTKLFYSVPTAIAWKPDGTEAWVAIETADVVAKMTVDAAGIPTVVGAGGAVGVTHVDLQRAGVPGKAPFGLCFNAAGTRLFVNNFVTRTVTVVDPAALAIVGSAQAGTPAPPGDLVARGAELFFTGRGPTRPGAGAGGVMSANGWGACVACHPDGRTDNVTWMFDAGPRQTIPLDGMFSKKSLNDQRVLNWSAVRDEDQDFELNTRAVSGGAGLINNDRLVMIVGGNDTGDIPNGRVESLLVGLPVTTVNTTNPLVLGAPALPGIVARIHPQKTTLLDGRLYVLGGLNPTLNTTLSDIVEYDPSTNAARTRTTALLSPRYYGGASALRGPDGRERIYVYGGYDATGNPTSTVEEYDPLANTIRLLPAGSFMPNPVAEFGHTTVRANNTNNPQDIAHVMCGNAGADGTVNPTSTILRFQPDTLTWTTMVPAAGALTPRFSLGAAAYLRGVNYNVVVMGGKDLTNNATTTVEEYQLSGTTSTVTLTATALTQLPVAMEGLSGQLGVVQNQVLIAGGVDGVTGNPTTSIVLFNPANNGVVPGVPGRPSGTFTRIGNMAVAREALAISVPPPVANLTPVGNTFRDVDQDAIAQWIAAAVRSHVAPLAGTTVPATQTAIAAGRTFFTTIDVSGGSAITCATCHGGPKWTRSRVDYVSPPSASLQFGFQQIQGAELRFTQSQPKGRPLASAGAEGVLLNVGTFQANGGALGRINEVRPDPGDAGSRIGALGGNGFNIPSLLSVAGTAPYYYSGLALTLDQALNGTVDGQGASALKSVHNVGGPGGTGTGVDRANLIQFLQSIDASTQPVP